MTEPSIKEKHFACPYCRSETEHTWLNAYASPIHNPAGIPLRIEGDGLEMLKRNPQFPPEIRDQKVAYWNKVNKGDVFLDRWAPVQSDMLVAGMELSICHACSELAIWLGGSLVHPKTDSK